MGVDLAILQEVQEAVHTGSSERRSEILQRVTDLFVLGSGHYSDEEISLFDDVFLRLTIEIELAARALLAVRLAPIPNAPPGIIRKLAFDEAIDVAGPVLRKSQRLDDPTLIETAREKGQEHLIAISDRACLTEHVTDVLLERGNQQVAFTLARNPGARFSENGFTILVQHAEGDDELATALGRRAEIPSGVFLKLLAKASDAVRAKLEHAHPEFKVDVQQAVGEVRSRLRAETIEKSARYIAAREAVERLASSGELDDARLKTFAASGWFEETTLALGLMCELPLEFVEGVMLEERSETILIIARMIGLSWPTLKAVLSLRAGDGGFSRHELEQCRLSFERLKPAIANEIVRYYRTRPMSGSKITAH